MIQSFFFISNSGEVIIEKHWRGVTPRTVCDYFYDEASKYENKEDMPPVVATSKYYLISIYRANVFLMATSTGEIAPLLVIEFLHRVFEIFEEYFGNVEEATIKDNFSMVYQLLEEMMDYGYPLTTEPNALKEMIAPHSVISRLMTSVDGIAGTDGDLSRSNVSDVLPDGTLSNMPWRKTGVKYSQNEIYLDIIEELDSILDKNGNIVSSEVSGYIIAQSKLSGVPDLALSFMDPGLIDDCSFHPCVRYNRFERDKIVSFVPPDGLFELMRYRVNTTSPIVAPCHCQPIIVLDSKACQGSITVSLGCKQHSSLLFPSGSKKGAVALVDVVLVIPFSRNVKTTNLTVTVGTILFDESTKIARWNVGKLGGDGIQQMKGSFMLHGPAVGDEAPAVELEWSFPMMTISGLAVQSLQLSNETYKPYKGVRTIVKSGKFHIRTV